MLTLGCIDQGWREGGGSRQPRAGSTPGCCQPGATGRWGGGWDPPPKGAAGLICAAEPGSGARSEQSCGCWGGRSSASRPGGFQPLPLSAERCRQHGRQRRRALGCSIVWRGGKSSSASPPLPPPCLQPRAESGTAAAWGPRDPHRPQTCLPLLLPANPSPRGPAPAARSARAVPASVRRSWRAEGGASGASVPTRCQARGGRRCETAADGRRCGPWHEGAVALPPSPGRGGSPRRELLLEPRLHRGREGAIPTQNRPGDRVCPCPLWPRLPEGWQSPRSSWVTDRSRVPAVGMARQQWKMANNAALGSSRLGNASPGLQGLCLHRGN